MGNLSTTEYGMGGIFNGSPGFWEVIRGLFSKQKVGRWEEVRFWLGQVGMVSFGTLLPFCIKHYLMTIGEDHGMQPSPNGNRMIEM